MTPLRAILLIVFVSKNFVYCNGILMHSGNDRKEAEWLYVVLNVWLLTLITLALWQYFRSETHTGMHPTYLPFNDLHTVSHFPRSTHRDPGAPFHPPQYFPAIPAPENWAPQYHTHIYCNGNHAQHGGLPDNGLRAPPPSPSARRRRRRRRRRNQRRDRRDLSPEWYRQLSPFGGLSSISNHDSNEPAPVPMNSADTSTGSIAQDEDSGSVNSFTSTIRNARNRMPRIMNTPHRNVYPQNFQVHRFELQL